MALGVFDMRWPPYAADLTLELYQHRQTNQAFVKVSYVGQVRHGLGSCDQLLSMLYSFFKMYLFLCIFIFIHLLFHTHLFWFCAGSASTRL